MMMRTAVSAIVLLASFAAEAADPPHNIILFVADGLRAGMVTPQTAPAMAASGRQGVTFPNTHSMFPTFTMPNAAAMATGHILGDTGAFGNTICCRLPGASAGGQPDPVPGKRSGARRRRRTFRRQLLNEEHHPERGPRARATATAAIGKLGPALIFDHTERERPADHRHRRRRPGAADGIPLGADDAHAIEAAGLPT